MKFVQGDIFTVELPQRSFALVYADPPYANCRFKYARRNGSRQWGRDARADYLRELISRMESLRAEDGMCALSMASPELRLLPLFPTNARVLPWVKTYAPMRPGVSPCYAWEPLVIWGKFQGRAEQKGASTPLDWHESYLKLAPKVPRGTNHETPKPEEFAVWVLRVTLGPRTGSVLELFGGTCPVARVAEFMGMESTAVDFDDYRGNQITLGESA